MSDQQEDQPLRGLAELESPVSGSFLQYYSPKDLPPHRNRANYPFFLQHACGYFYRVP